MSKRSRWPWKVRRHSRGRPASAVRQEQRSSARSGRRTTISAPHRREPPRGTPRTRWRCDPTGPWPERCSGGARRSGRCTATRTATSPSPHRRSASRRGTKDVLYRWSPGDRAPTRLRSGIVAAAWIPDPAPSRPARAIAVIGGAGAPRNTVRIVDARNGHELRRVAIGAEPLRAITVEPGGTTAVVAPGGTADSPCDGTMQRVDLDDGSETPILGEAAHPVVDRDGVVAYGFNCDGTSLAFTERDGSNYRADALRDRGVRIAAVDALSWSPNGTWLAYRLRVVGESDWRYLAARIRITPRTVRMHRVAPPSASAVTAVTFLDDTHVALVLPGGDEQAEVRSWRVGATGSERSAPVIRRLGEPARASRDAPGRQTLAVLSGRIVWWRSTDGTAHEIPGGVTDAAYPRATAEVAGIEPTGRGSPVPLVLKTRGATRPRSPPGASSQVGGPGVTSRRDRPRDLGAVRGRVVDVGCADEVVLAHRQPEVRRVAGDPRAQRAVRVDGLVVAGVHQHRDRPAAPRRAGRRTASCTGTGSRTRDHVLDVVLGSRRRTRARTPWCVAATSPRFVGARAARAGSQSQSSTASTRRDVDSVWLAGSNRTWTGVCVTSTLVDCSSFTICSMSSRRASIVRRCSSRHRAGERGVPVPEHEVDLRERHVERAQPDDHRGVGELVHRVVAVARLRVDACRHEDAGVVVRAQRLDRERARTREHPDREQRLVHDAHPRGSGRGDGGRERALHRRRARVHHLGDRRLERVREHVGDPRDPAAGRRRPRRAPRRRDAPRRRARSCRRGGAGPGPCRRAARARPCRCRT